MAQIFSSKKLLDRIRKWGIDRADGATPDGDSDVLNIWYGTYAIIEKQHVVVLVNDPTYLTLVIAAQDFKRSPTEAMCIALEPLLEELKVPGEVASSLLDTCDAVQFTFAQDRSMVSRLNHVLHHVMWRMYNEKPLAIINLEMVDEMYSAGKYADPSETESATPRRRMATVIPAL